MDEPRQYGTLGGFIESCSEMDSNLRIYADVPWTAASAAVVTRAMKARPDDDDEHDLVRVFGDDDHDLPFIMYVGELQQLVKQARKAKLKGLAAISDHVLSIVRKRMPS